MNKCKWHFALLPPIPLASWFVAYQRFLQGPVNPPLSYSETSEIPDGQTEMFRAGCTQERRDAMPAYAETSPEKLLVVVANDRVPPLVTVS